MKKITFTILLTSVVALTTSSQELMRSTLGALGSSTTIVSTSKKYVIQQSVGQSSVIGKFKADGIIARQGFIQPPTISSKVITEETNLEAVIYPNPVNNLVNIAFNEPINEPVSIQIFDMLGRRIFVNQMDAAQQLSVDLSFLSIAQYVFLINTGQKQFKTNLIKQ